MSDRALGWFLEQVDVGIAGLPETRRAAYAARADNELGRLRSAGWLPLLAECADTVVTVAEEGLPLAAAHRSNESVLFFLAGMTSTDPLQERLNDGFLDGVRGSPPAWLWFGAVDHDPFVAESPVIAACLRLGNATMSALRWRDDAPGEIRQLRNAACQLDVFRASQVPLSWSDLVLQHACATPRGHRLGMYEAVVDGVAGETGLALRCFRRTGGIPVFEDDVIAFLRDRLGREADAATVNRTRRAVRRGDRRALTTSLGAVEESLLDLLVLYGPSTMPRSVAIGEARLELCAAWAARPTPRC